MKLSYIDNPGHFLHTIENELLMYRSIHNILFLSILFMSFKRLLHKTG